MTFGELIYKILEWLVEFWPLHRINEWEQGVLVRSGKIVGKRTHTTGLFGTGWHLLLPFLHELEIDDCNIEAELTTRLDFTSRDGQPVSVVGAVQYEVFDMSLLWKAVHDHEDSVLTIICAEIVGAGSKLRFIDMMDHLSPEARCRSNRTLEPWGVRVVALNLAGLTQTKALRLIGGHGGD